MNRTDGELSQKKFNEERSSTCLINKKNKNQMKKLKKNKKKFFEVMKTLIFEAF